jgi:Bacterial Ig-like domain (group 1)
MIVGVVDQDGRPVEGVTVFWTALGGGSVDPETVVTDFDGRASAFRLLGPTAGDQTTTAAVGEAAGDSSGDVHDHSGSRGLAQGRRLPKSLGCCPIAPRGLSQWCSAPSE